MNADVRPFRRSWHSPADASGHHRRKASEGGGKFQPQDWPIVTSPSDPAMIAMLAEGRFIRPLGRRYGFTTAELAAAGRAAGLFYDGKQGRMSTKPIRTVRPPKVRQLPGGAGWKFRGACRDEDPELFFAEEPRPIAQAKRVCSPCPVRPVCLEAAVAGRESGVWGGEYLISGTIRRDRRSRASRKAVAA